MTAAAAEHPLLDWNGETQSRERVRTLSWRRMNREGFEMEKEVLLNL